MFHGLCLHDCVAVKYLCPAHFPVYSFTKFPGGLTLPKLFAGEALTLCAALFMCRFVLWHFLLVFFGGPKRNYSFTSTVCLACGPVWRAEHKYITLIK